MSERGDRPPGHVPAIAISGDLAPGVLTAAGWRVTGRLPSTPYEEPAGLADLLAAARVLQALRESADTGVAVRTG